jgi:Domain of unknown function (DUF4166)
MSGATHGIKALIGDAAWQRLAAAVRERFMDPARRVDYAGTFEIVRASMLGRVLAWFCRCLGTPVVPRVGAQVPALVQIFPTDQGVTWRREYRWPARPPYVVRSTKVIAADGTLIERLPAGLCMPLDLYESAGALHFVSRGYYFDIAVPGTRARLKIPLLPWLSPGVTHVSQVDEPDGWFRFTLTVTHPLFGEVFYQTGRFSEVGDSYDCRTLDDHRSGITRRPRQPLASRDRRALAGQARGGRRAGAACSA